MNELPDLASIVLADADTSRHDGASGRFAGQDPRSILILAVVVATLAMVVAWTATVGRDDQVPASVKEQPAATKAADASQATVVAAKTPAKPKAVPGVDLSLGQISTVKSGSGGVLVRVGVRNLGADPLTGPAAAKLLVLVDGERAGSTTIGEIASVDFLGVEVPLEQCSGGEHFVMVVVDPTGRITEANERDNTNSRTATFDC